MKEAENGIEEAQKYIKGPVGGSVCVQLAAISYQAALTNIAIAGGHMKDEKQKQRYNRGIESLYDLRNSLVDKAVSVAAEQTANARKDIEDRENWNLRMAAAGVKQTPNYSTAAIMARAAASAITYAAKAPGVADNEELSEKLRSAASDVGELRNFLESKKRAA